MGIPYMNSEVTLWSCDLQEVHIWSFRWPKYISHLCLIFVCSSWLIDPQTLGIPHVLRMIKYACAVLCPAGQLCPTLCEPMVCSPPDSSVHGILQARLLEWVAISFSRGSSRPRDQTCLHCRQIPFHLSHQGSPKVSLVILMRWVCEHPRMRTGGRENQSGLTLSLPPHAPTPPTSVKGRGPQGWILQ